MVVQAAVRLALPMAWISLVSISPRVTDLTPHQIAFATPTTLVDRFGGSHDLDMHLESLADKTESRVHKEALEHTNYAMGTVTMSSPPHETDPKALSVVIVTGSTHGMALARTVVDLYTNNLHTAHARVTSGGVVQHLRSSHHQRARAMETEDALHRDALSELVAMTLKKDGNTLVVLNESVFHAIPGALTVFHTCWDVRGNLEGPRVGRVSCDQATFLTIVAMDPSTTPTPLDACGTATDDECHTVYADHVKAARVWLKSRILPSSRREVEKEREAIMRRISDVVWFA
eukprot:m.152998 g.152998  ORF g.152998 m.152998 type:complete len:289 (+) comp11705_c0_seq10:62-928(+)